MNSMDGRMVNNNRNNTDKKILMNRSICSHLVILAVVAASISDIARDSSDIFTPKMFSSRSESL